MRRSVRSPTVAALAWCVLGAMAVIAYGVVADLAQWRGVTAHSGALASNTAPSVFAADVVRLDIAVGSSDPAVLSTARGSRTGGGVLPTDLAAIRALSSSASSALVSLGELHLDARDSHERSVGARILRDIVKTSSSARNSPASIEDTATNLNREISRLDVWAGSLGSQLGDGP